MNTTKFVYRVFTFPEWELFQKKRKFKGNRFDLKSGFIHLSKKTQIKKTIVNYFSEYKKLIIAEFNVSNFNELLKWEISENNEVFPHYYCSLNYNDVNSYLFIKRKVHGL